MIISISRFREEAGLKSSPPIFRNQEIKKADLGQRDFLAKFDVGMSGIDEGQEKKQKKPKKTTTADLKGWGFRLLVKQSLTGSGRSQTEFVKSEI